MQYLSIVSDAGRNGGWVTGQYAHECCVDVFRYMLITDLTSEDSVKKLSLTKAITQT